MKYNLLIEYIPEKEGFSVLALNLPGCASQGDTKTQCLYNIEEAAIGCLESYLEENQNIPWRLVHIEHNTDNTELISVEV